MPYGKKFQLLLSDGTEVYLNSGSSITYPVIFYDEGPRNVVLRGEAYFTVASDSLRPFTVSTQLLDAKVLGTEFNISSYRDDEHIQVVLIEGSLSVGRNNSIGSGDVILKPNQLASYSYSDDELSTANIDVSSYIAWKNGILLFKNEDFYHIAKKLERHYDVKIEIKDMQVSKERYTGRFKTETIEEILQAFQRIKSFDYNIENNNIKKLIYFSNKDYVRDLMLFSIFTNIKLCLLNGMNFDMRSWVSCMSEVVITPNLVNTLLLITFPGKKSPPSIGS